MSAYLRHNPDLQHRCIVSTLITLPTHVCQDHKRRGISSLLLPNHGELWAKESAWVDDEIQGFLSRLGSRFVGLRLSEEHTVLTVTALGPQRAHSFRHFPSLALKPLLLRFSLARNLPLMLLACFLLCCNVLGKQETREQHEWQVASKRKAEQEWLECQTGEVPRLSPSYVALLAEYRAT